MLWGMFGGDLIYAIKYGVPFLLKGFIVLRSTYQQLTKTKEKQERVPSTSFVLCVAFFLPIGGRAGCTNELCWFFAYQLL